MGRGPKKDGKGVWKGQVPILIDSDWKTNEFEAYKRWLFSKAS